MKIFEVWNEGYAATGQQEKAQCLGTFEAETFQEACKNALIELKWDMSYYDEEDNSFWACRFFDNEKDARKSFG
jgi:hypothetical protein